MRLSEAILLGSTVMKPKPGALRFANENSGCALGMAVIASGGTFVRREHPVPETERRTLNVEDVWGAWLLQRVVRPCNCGVPLVLNRLSRKKTVTHPRYPIFHLPREMRVKDILAHRNKGRAREFLVLWDTGVSTWEKRKYLVDIINGEEIVNRHTYATFPGYGWDFGDGENSVTTPVEIGKGITWKKLYSSHAQAVQVQSGWTFRSMFRPPP